MTNLEWLLGGDPVIAHLVKKYLLNEPTETQNQGLIQRYLNLLDPQTMKWGNGFYGPKWVSTHYTLMELKYMEIMPKTPVYTESLLHYMDHEWEKNFNKYGIDTMDLCITGMLINLVSYAKIQDPRLNQMIDYTLRRTMPDGAWNCCWHRKPRPHISSVHTTINVLEGLAEYIQQGYTYRLEEVQAAIERGIQVLMVRQLIYKKNTDTPIHPSMTEHHYPARWKYDYLRILEMLARIGHPYQKEMEPALSVLKGHLKNGKLTKGTRISGLTHFKLETEKYGRFNTFRAYVVLKAYYPEVYQNCIAEEFKE